MQTASETNRIKTAQIISELKLRLKAKFKVFWDGYDFYVDIVTGPGYVFRFRYELPDKVLSTLDVKSFCNQIILSLKEELLAKILK